MALSSKQRAGFRSQAQDLEPLVMVGKDGLTDGVIGALDSALTNHELVKVRFQNFKDKTGELSRELEKATSSMLIATTGFTAVFFRKKGVPSQS